MNFEAGINTALRASTALTNLLAAGTASIYSTLALQGASPPYVTFSKQANTPYYTAGGGTAYENAVYLVKAITQSTSAALAGSIAVEIDRALNGATLTITGYTPMVCYRESDVSYAEIVDGQTFQHRGAMFRIQAQPS